MDTAAAPWPNDPLICCRFCLRDSTGSTDMFSISAEQLLYSGLPQLFEAATGVKLDMSAGYSEMFCANCENQIRLGAKIRGDLLRIANQWKENLWTESDADMVELLTADSESQSTEVDADYQGDVLKTEQCEESPVCSSAGIDKVENVDEGRAKMMVERSVVGAVKGDNKLKDELGSGDDDVNDNADDEDENGDSSDTANSSSAEEEDSEDKPIVRKTSKSQQRLVTPLTCDICGSKLTSRYVQLILR